MQRWYLQSMQHHPLLIALSQATDHSAAVLTIPCSGAAVAHALTRIKHCSNHLPNMNQRGLVPFAV